MKANDEEIREQVQKLLKSELFQTSEVQRRLLLYLAEKSLTGEADMLKEYTVGVEGLEYSNITSLLGEPILFLSTFLKAGLSWWSVKLL